MDRLDQHGRSHGGLRSVIYSPWDDQGDEVVKSLIGYPFSHISQVSSSASNMCAVSSITDIPRESVTSAFFFSKMETASSVFISFSVC